MKSEDRRKRRESVRSARICNNQHSASSMLERLCLKWSSLWRWAQSINIFCLLFGISFVRLGLRAEERHNQRTMNKSRKFGSLNSRHQTAVHFTHSRIFRDHRFDYSAFLLLLLLLRCSLIRWLPFTASWPRYSGFQSNVRLIKHAYIAYYAAVWHAKHTKWDIILRKQF